MTNTVHVGRSDTDNWVTVTTQPTQTTAGGIVLVIAEPPQAGLFEAEWTVEGPVLLSRSDADIALLGATTVTGDPVDVPEGGAIRATLDTGRSFSGTVVQPRNQSTISADLSVPVLAYTALLSVATGLLFGIVPAWRGGWDIRTDAVMGRASWGTGRTLRCWPSTKSCPPGRRRRERCGRPPPEVLDPAVLACEYPALVR